MKALTRIGFFRRVQIAAVDPCSFTAGLRRTPLQVLLVLQAHLKYMLSLSSQDGCGNLGGRIAALNGSGVGLDITMDYFIIIHTNQ